MQNPRNLKVRREARALAVATYRLTAGFPTHERFGLTSQMQRAAVSVGSNIAEGCGGRSDRAMVAYLRHAVGSLNELEFQLEVATQLSYCESVQSLALLSQLRSARRMLVGLTRQCEGARRTTPDLLTF
ncbi:MAG TPA: four helix bundle protein [Thermoanaerobaculia bacterium]|jgi:four helix bundle protein